MTANKKVFIVGVDPNVRTMFEETEGWACTDSIKEADLVQFTGGADVSPEYYNHKRHTTTVNAPARDKKEKQIYEEAIELSNVLGIAGICRGGQFLHVMNHGTMYQNVNNHAINPKQHHSIRVVTASGGTTYIAVTSTHHQMMRDDSTREHVLLGWAEKVSTYRTLYDPQDDRFWDDFYTQYDPEIILYPKHNVLCFQPHPEYCDKGHPCRSKYIEILNEMI